MKILMLGWELPPHNSGGLGVACLNLCKSLADSGADIEFILPYKAEHQVPFMKLTYAKNHKLSQEEIIGAYESYFGFDNFIEGLSEYTSTVAKIVSTQKFDVIHAHDWLTFRAALKAKQLTDWPLVVHIHSIENDRAGGHKGNPVIREIESLTMTLADRVIAVSNHTKEMIIQEYGIPADKIEVVHNSVNPDDFKRLSDENVYVYLSQMRSLGYRVISNVGRQTIQKGLPNLLRAAKEVIARSPKTLFLLVGDGEQYHELISLSAELGISANVFFTGFQRGKNWRDAFSVSDLFVMPSVSEPFGLTPLEAIGYGSPALISKQSGIAEILTNALKVDYWDVDEMANQITAVVQNDGLRDTLLTNAYDEFEGLSWSSASDKVMSIYNQHVQGATA